MKLYILILKTDTGQINSTSTFDIEAATDSAAVTAAQAIIADHSDVTYSALYLVGTDVPLV